MQKILNNSELEMNQKEHALMEAEDSYFGNLFNMDNKNSNDNVHHVQVVKVRKRVKESRENK